MLIRRRNIGLAGGACACVLLLLWMMWPTREAQIVSDSGQVCRYGAAYGAVYDLSTGAPVEANPENLEPILDSLLACAERWLPPAEAVNYELQRALLPPPPTAGDWQATFGLIELAAAISHDENVDQQDRTARRLLHRAGIGDIQNVIESQGALKVLLENRWISEKPALSHQAMLHYVDQCKAAGVPVPRAINTDPGWISKEGEDLSAEVDRYFVATEKTDVRMWTFEASNGGKCFSLLRHDPAIGKTVDTDPMIGTICVDPNWQEACFFDNEVYDAAGKVVRLDEATTLATDLDQLVHPTDGIDTCQSCHMGKNPFILHPGTKLAELIGKPVKYAEHFNFVTFDQPGTPDWVNPNSVDLEGDKTCTDCHILPKTTNSYYCDNILTQAVNKTMPPGMTHAKGKSYWPDGKGCFPDDMGELADYTQSLLRLQAVCAGKSEVTTCGR